MNLLRNIVISQITYKSTSFYARPYLKSLEINYRNVHNIISSNIPCRTIDTSILKNIKPINEVAVRKFKSISPIAVQRATLKERFAKFLGLSKESKYRLQINGLLMYEKVVDNIDYIDFVERFHLKNTFNSWFLITELHIWMLMVRSAVENDKKKIFRNSLVTAMWQDVGMRSKKMVPHSRSLINKQIEQLGDEFRYAIIAYDEGLMRDDKQLASAIWYRFFESGCDNYEQIELLIKYIRINIRNLDNLSREEFIFERKLDWISLKECENDV